ncbi:MAG: hypothetical protein HY881_23385 [Deltaproteobacteria bacterium]|nr:hypothetical protein [Deltaproteobacteria bacterium]
MTEATSLPDNGLQFFRSLFIKTGGDTKKQVSMHEIGNEAGLDKPASKNLAEELMSLGLIDIRTLSGGIGLTEEGVLEAQGWFSDIPGAGTAGITLGNQPIVGEKSSAVIMDILTDLKPRIGKLGMAFDDLTELLADIQSLEAQMRSSRPKTAIVRECFRSMLPILTRSSETEIPSRIKSFLAD